MERLLPALIRFLAIHFPNLKKEEKKQRVGGGGGRGGGVRDVTSSA